MSKKTKPKYNTEYREREVKMVINSDKSTAQVARDLGVKSTTLYSWLNSVEVEKVKDSSKSNEELFAELKKVKKV